MSVSCGSKTGSRGGDPVVIRPASALRGRDAPWSNSNDEPSMNELWRVRRCLPPDVTLQATRGNTRQSRCLRRVCQSDAAARTMHNRPSGGSCSRGMRLPIAVWGGLTMRMRMRAAQVLAARSARSRRAQARNADTSMLAGLHRWAVDVAGGCSGSAVVVVAGFTSPVATFAITIMQTPIARAEWRHAATTSWGGPQAVGGDGARVS